MLAIRVGELTAIDKLSQLSQTGVFADALAASAKKTGTAIGKAVMNSVETVSGIPAGVGRFFQSASTKVSRATESTGSSKSLQRRIGIYADLLGNPPLRLVHAKETGRDGRRRGYGPRFRHQPLVYAGALRCHSSRISPKFRRGRVARRSLRWPALWQARTKRGSCSMRSAWHTRSALNETQSSPSTWLGGSWWFARVAVERRCLRPWTMSSGPNR